MEIRLGSLVDDAEEAEGTVIIVDVFRAFTTAAIAFDRGAARIVLVAEVEEAMDLYHRGVGDLTMGEVDGKRPHGFHFGNSPHEISRADLFGKTIIQSTRAGTVGVAAAARAEIVYLGSFVVAAATAAAVKQENPNVVSIIAMGDRGAFRSDEDEQCALYLRNLLEGRQPDLAALRSLVMSGGQTLKFFDESQPQYHPEDVELALQVNRFPFSMRISREKGLLVARSHQSC